MPIEAKLLSGTIESAQSKVEAVSYTHLHTNAPWKVLEYGASLGDIHDVVVENMERQENGLQG